MSARDWRSIGDAPSLPHWLWWAALPVTIPAAAMAWIAIHWDQLPLRYGDRGLTRTLRHVYGMPVFGAGLALLLAAAMLCTWYGSRRAAADLGVLKLMLAVAWLMSALFTVIGLAPLVGLPKWTIVVSILVAAIVMIVYVFRTMSAADDGTDGTPVECWSLGGIYYNPLDAALFVRARVGNGYTLNMANRRAYPFLIGMIGGVGLLVVFLIWSQR